MLFLFVLIYLKGTWHICYLNIFKIFSNCNHVYKNTAVIDRSAWPIRAAPASPAPRKRIDVRIPRPAASSFTVVVGERHHEGVWHST